LSQCRGRRQKGRICGKGAEENRMTDREQIIANQMIKGCNAKCYNRNKAASEKDFLAFCEMHKAVIAWVDSNAPTRINAGVLGVIGKAALWHGRDKVKEFCDRIAKIEFKGEHDPCHELWQYLLRLKNGKNTTEVYRRAVTAMRAFLEGRDLSYLRPSSDDIFEWDQTYTHMRRARWRNQHGKAWEERCALQ
jgi:hypothetical protein